MGRGIFVPLSVGPLLEVLMDVLPGLERLVRACHDLLPDPRVSNQPSACDSCPKKETCTKSCDDILKAIPKINQGRGRRENLTGFYESTLNRIQETRNIDVFKQYEECKDLFTAKEWVAIYLRYHDGKKIGEIAEMLSIKKGSVGDRLSNAKKKKEQHYRELRAEKLEFLRKINNDDP